MFIKDRQSWDRFVISVEDDIKIKDFLMDNLGFSVRSISKLKRERNLTLNGRTAKPTETAHSGDIIEIQLKEEKSDFKPQNLDVDFLYEDFDLLIADKPPFMVVHPTKSHFENTLANAVSFHIEKTGENCRIRFVNRLDMNTSGIVVVAKNAYAHHSLSMDMSEDRVKKEYIAVVRGVVEEDSGIIDLPIYRPTDDSIRRVIDSRGQQSRTGFEVVERLEDATVLKLRLYTGRTHQIRVHLSHIGHGIIGDELYGHVDESLIDRQALHAYRISIQQPRLKEKIDITAPIPDDMKRLIKKLGGMKDDNK